MNFGRILLFVFFGVIILLISCVSFSEAQVFSLTGLTTTVKPKAASAACSLGCGSGEDLVCASNGVTYKNSCRYECALSRNKRLRMVKKGRCGNVSLQEYRAGQKKTSAST